MSIQIQTMKNNIIYEGKTSLYMLLNTNHMLHNLYHITRILDSCLFFTIQYLVTRKQLPWISWTAELDISRTVPQHI